MNQPVRIEALRGHCKHGLRSMKASPSIPLQTLIESCELKVVKGEELQFTVSSRCYL